MSWLSLLTALMQLVGSLAKYLGDRRLIRAGEAQAVAEGQKDAINRLALARLAAQAPDSSKPGDRDWAERVRDRFRTDRDAGG